MNTAFRMASATLLALTGLTAQAQSKDIVVDPKGDVPYAIDQRNVVVKSGADLCWRTGSWTPAAAGSVQAGELPVGCQCDRDVVGADTCQPPAARGASGAPAAAVAAPAAAVAAPRTCDFSVTLNADQSFAFGKATLSPAARRALDEVATRSAQCASVRALLITGHTDRLGTQAYNQKLSEKRAGAVSSYLAGKGLKAGDVEIMGAGKTQPIKGCDDSLGHKKLVDCLAPNRRVTIDVKGPAK